MMRSSFCCQLQHPLPPSLSNVWWDIKRRHWATRDGCTPRDGTCLQCLEAVGFLTILQQSFRTKNLFEKSWNRKISFHPTENQLHIIQGTKWDRDWLDLDLMTFRDASPPKNGDNSGNSPCYVSDAPVSGDIWEQWGSKLLFIKLMELYVFFHSSPTTNTNVKCCKPFQHLSKV